MQFKASSHTGAALLMLLACMAGQSQANTIISCYSCQGINCQRTTLLEQQQQCLDSLDYCVTIYDKSKVLYKGCSLQIPIELRKRCEGRDLESCYKCNSDRCNNVSAPRFACLQCDSSQHTDCVNNASAFSPSLCAATTAANSYCFVRAGNGVQRGCATTLMEQQSCLGDENCMLCSPGDVSNCNSVSIVAGDKGSRFFRFLK